MKVFGWSMDDWALAAARYPEFQPDRNGAYALFARCNCVPPGAIKGFEYPSDYEWVVKMFHAVNMEMCGVGGALC